jgi:hypothetical protein
MVAPLDTVIISDKGNSLAGLVEVVIPGLRSTASDRGKVEKSVAPLVVNA